MPKSGYSWVPKKVNYDLREGRKALKSQGIRFSDYHPLKPIMVTESSGVRAVSSKRRQSDASSTKSISSSVEVDFVDPLSALSGTDPLSMAAAAPPDPSLSKVEKTTDSEYGDDFEHWSSRKLSILNKYSLDEKLSMTMVALTNPVDSSGRRFAYSSIEEKLQTRLNQLNDMAEGSVKELKVETQREFVEKIREHEHNLRQAWEANQKVNALKIAIQCAKMLGDTAVMQYYPSKFVLIADILDLFGQFVFSRILSMCGGMTAENIDPAKVPENAREICLNWMLKIASIRELLPRIYIEACILPCYNFIKKDERNSVLVRLTNMVRGVGNPLVSVHVRTYLCMTGVKHAAKFKGHLNTNFYDFVATYKQLHTTPVQNEIAHQRISMATYLSLYAPALEFILSCVAYKAHESTLKDVLEKCEKTGSSLLLLKCVLASFKPEYISARALEFCSTISQSNDNLFPKASVFHALGVSACAADPPEKERLTLLNEVWKFIIKLQEPADYISCAGIWAEYAVKNFKKREVNTILGDILKHMVPDRAFERHYPQLQDVVKKILTHMTDFSVVFSMDKFLPFQDMFQNEGVKVEVCKCIAEFFTKASDTSTSDPLVINGMMYVCKAMHDSINSLSLDSDVRSVSEAICGVVQKVTFGRDFEQQLNFYVECRASFRNLDLVLSTLVHLVNALSAKATKIVKHNHTTKTAAFVRACAAYCFITIPSLSSVYLRLSLYLASGQAALISHCITQADAMFCAAITQILEMPATMLTPDGKNVSSQNLLTSYVLNFLSTLLTVPDHPEQGVLYLLRGLVNVIAGNGENSGPLAQESRITIYINALGLLTAYSQDKYLYQVDNVDSNENLYSSDEKFLAEISSVGTTLLDELLAHISSLDSQGKYTKRSEIALELFSAILAHGDVENDAGMQKLAVSTWGVATSGTAGNLKLMAKILESIKNRGNVYSKLASKLALPGK